MNENAKRVCTEDEQKYEQRKKTEEQMRKKWKRLIELQKMRVHPFDFLETVLSAVKIVVLPDDKHFFGHGKIQKTKLEKLNMEQYEILMRAHENDDQIHAAEKEYASYYALPEFRSMLNKTKGCWRLKHAIEQAIFKNDALRNDVVYKDLRGRLGAQVRINSSTNLELRDKECQARNS